MTSVAETSTFCQNFCGAQLFCIRSIEYVGFSLVLPGETVESTSISLFSIWTVKTKMLQTDFGTCTCLEKNKQHENYPTRFVSVSGMTTAPRSTCCITWHRIYAKVCLYRLGDCTQYWTLRLSNSFLWCGSLLCLKSGRISSFSWNFPGLTPAS